MSLLSAIPAGTPSLTLCAALRACPSLRHASECETSVPILHSSCQRVELRTVQTAAAESKMRIDSAQIRLAVCFSRFCSGTASGTIPAPCGTALFCFGYAALRVTAVPEKTSKPRHRTPQKFLQGPSVNAELGTWEPGPCA